MPDRLDQSAPGVRPAPGSRPRRGGVAPWLAWSCGLAGAVLVAACDGGGRPAEIPATLVVRVTGQDFAWYVDYPGRDGQLDTPDDVHGERDLHVPVGREIVVVLNSTDYIYGFRVPDFGVNQMAVPELSFAANFRADSPGTHALRGDQMCGFQHESLLGRVIVYSQSDYESWLEEQRS